MYYLEPHGDRVLGLGLDRNDSSGNLNVSLFDVSDMSNPTLVERVAFGPTNMYEDYMITNGVLAEDQDRIQKAFRVFPDGLIAVPFSGGGNSYGDTMCDGAGSGVQLLDWTRTSLTKHAFLPVVGNARRAIRRDSPAMKELIAISDSNVSAFQVDLRDSVVPTANVVIGTCTPRATPSGGGFGGGGGWGNPQGQLGSDVSGSGSYGNDTWSGDTCN
jgi:hypothetical protein